MRKTIVFILLLLSVVAHLTSCDEADVPSGAADSSAATVGTPTTEAETLCENSVTLPAQWPEEADEPTVYRVEPSENSSAEGATCEVSLTYTEYLQGDRSAVDISLTVNGNTYTDYTAYLRYNGDASVQATIPIVGYSDMFFYADIPSDAVCGTYDLVVKAEAVGYEGTAARIITVGQRNTTAFSFAYEIEKTIYSLTELDNLRIKLAVINEGDPFILYENDYVYNVYEAYLSKTENGTTVTYPLFHYTHAGEMWEVQYIAHGEPSVDTYRLEEMNAETGIYDLVVSYGECQQTFENALKIIE